MEISHMTEGRETAVISFGVGKTYVPLNKSGMHTHPGWEIILNQSGEGNYFFAQGSLPFSSGTIVCVPPKTGHAKIARDTFEDIFLTTADTRLFEGNEVLATSDDEFKSIGKVMELIHYAYFRDEQKISAAAAGLFDALVEMIRERASGPEGNPYAQRIRRRIIQRFTDPEFTAADAFRDLPYCTDYLRRLFREEYGITPQDYLIHLRMEKARRMLTEQKHVPVSEVALSCGFYDARYFSRLFRRTAGCAPKEYSANGSSVLST